MIFQPEIFYLTFQKDYHKIKAIYLKGLIDNQKKYESEIFGNDIDEEDKINISRTFKSDLRQTYFHCIETFFEIFFALNPKKYNQRDVLFNITNSNWTKSYENIGRIATNEEELNFLDEEIIINNKKQTIGQYLFYCNILTNAKISIEKINESIEAIKYGIIQLAKEFTKREEYNAYKHGLRLIPAVNKISLLNIVTKNEELSYNIDDSMSFYAKTKNKDELKVVTKLFDYERDFNMTIVCSNFIHQLIYFRRLSYDFDNDTKKKEQIPVFFYSKENLLECNKINVEIQDIIYTVKQVK